MPDDDLEKRIAQIERRLSSFIDLTILVISLAVGISAGFSMEHPELMFRPFHLNSALTVGGVMLAVQIGLRWFLKW
jgi:hypothetical protein